MTMAYEYKDSLVKLNGICLDFDGKPILAGINAEVRDIVRPGKITGQIVGILGPSGVGKSMLARIMTGLQTPSSGSVSIGPKGEPVSAGRVGFVAQNYPLLRHRTILGNLLVASSEEDAGKSLEKAESLLSRFDLLNKRHLYPAQLSGGQRQRIAILQQFMCSEHYLVLDEPTTGLDPLMKDKVCNFIRDLANIAEENTIFLISHDIESVLSLADTLWLMGRDRNPQGESLGAKIQYVYNLIEKGLAWQTDPKATPMFGSLLREIRQRFETL